MTTVQNHRDEENDGHVSVQTLKNDMDVLFQVPSPWWNSSE